jgi:hypothetical protein
LGREGFSLFIALIVPPTMRLSWGTARSRRAAVSLHTAPGGSPPTLRSARRGHGKPAGGTCPSARAI